MKQLDSVRGLALGLVMVEHYGGQTVNTVVPIGAGSLGVGCFFTLSGFLITGILLQSFDTSGDRIGAAWRDFYARRLLRLAPAFYAVLLSLVLLGIEPITSSWPWHALYLTNVWIALGHPDNVFWSLSVEEQFYLLWPIIIAFVPRRWLIQTLIGLMILSLGFKFYVLSAGYDTRSVTRLLPGHLVLLSMGCLLATVSYRDGRANRFDWYTGAVRTWFDRAAWSALGAAAFIWLYFPESGLLRYFLNDILCGTFYAWLVLRAAIGFEGKVRKVFDSAQLQYVGRISYGLYLVHNWMPDIVEIVIGPLPKYAAAPIVLLATFGICSLSWYCFERPILSLKRYLPRASLNAHSNVTNKPVEPAAANNTVNAY